MDSLRPGARNYLRSLELAIRAGVDERDPDLALKVFNAGRNGGTFNVTTKRKELAVVSPEHRFLDG